MVSRYDVVRARGLDRGERLTRARQEWVRVPAGFERVGGVLRPGTEAVYREDRPTDALEIRLSGDRFVVRRHRYHPRYHPAHHLLADKLPGGFAAGIRRAGSGLGRLSGGLGRLSGGIRRLSGGIRRLGAVLGHRA